MSIDANQLNAYGKQLLKNFGAIDGPNGDGLVGRQDIEDALKRGKVGDIFDSLLLDDNYITALDKLDGKADGFISKNSLNQFA